MPLRLVVPDLTLDRDSLDATAVQALPRLPGLESLLRFGTRGAAPTSTRDLLAGLAGRPALAGQPPAQLVAAAAGLPRPASAWFATPVHRVAGLDHLRLHPAGVLRPDAAESAALAADFKQSFGADGLALQVVSGAWLLTGLEGLEAEAVDPAQCLGRDLREAAPTGPGAARLRRLGAEIEMWLHDRPAAPGRLPLNGLWLWGGGAGDVTSALREPASRTPVGRLQADDALARALWQLAGEKPAPLPRDAPGFFAGASGADDHEASCVLCLDTLPRSPGDRPMARLEADWFLPLCEALRDGRLRQLQLFIAGHLWSVRRPFGWQRWRRSRPWWEQLAA